jgi:hypothetical protein
MLKIRTAQEDALADEDFVRRLVVWLQTRMPQSTARLTFRELRCVVRHGIAVARSYDLRSERDLAAFVFDMLAVNPQFHRQPDIHAALSDPNVAVAERMDRATAAPEDAWAEAGKLTDPAAYWTEVLAREPAEPSGSSDPGGEP